MSASDASRISTSTAVGTSLRRCGTLALAGLLAAGCAGQQSILLPDFRNWEARRQYLAAADDWAFSGRVGVKAGDDGFNGKLRWRQDGATFATTVGGPLGIGTVRIDGSDRSVVLTDNDGMRTTLGDVERDLLDRYGWTIPVRSLRYWALGIPDPASPAQTAFGADGRLATLEQGGWNIAITHYREARGQPMPFRLTASQADTRVRIVIDNWLFYN